MLSFHTGWMLALRWAIGLGCGLGLALFAVIQVVGKGFEVYRSGAGGDDLAKAALPIAIPALLGGMLATVIWPQARGLQHALAAGVLLAVAGIAWSALPKHPGEAMIYLGFLGLWGAFYFLGFRNN